MFGKVKDLFFNITARDQSGSAFGSVNRRLRETDGLTASVNERMARAGRSMQRFGAVGSLATIGIASAFRDVLGLYDEQARAEAKVAQAVRQTGGAVGFTADELFRQASALQSVTRFGDEDILNNVTAQLLTFKNISSETFMGAQEAALDLATVLDGDLQSASIMLGKALNDPVIGLSAMSRAGVTFSEAQQQVIKDLARTGNVAEAQRLILEEIASAYGGQSEAARAAGTGIVDAWRNTWGDVKETVGQTVVEILPPIVNALETITGWFQDLTPQGQRAVVMFGALAIAIPPVTAALGLLVAGTAALGGPVTLAITGISALVAGLAAFWPETDKATQSTDLLTAALGDEITQSQLLQQAISGDISMSASVAKQKLAEARSRHENVKAIIAEQRALKLQSTDYATLLSDISDAEAATNSLGFPSIDAATPLNAEAFEQAQQRLVDLRKQQQDFLKAGDEYNDQLERTEGNIAALEEALANASGGMVTFGNGLTVPVETAERLKTSISGSGAGSGASGGLTGAIKELTVETEELGQSQGWDDIKSNLKALVFEGQSFSDTWDGLWTAITDRIFDAAVSPAWDAFSNVLDSALGGLGAGGGGGFLGLGGGGGGGAGNWIGNILGLDTGGDVRVSGKAGVDRNLTVLRTSDNENVSVRRQGDTGGGGRPIYVTIQTPDLRSFQGSQAQVGRQLSAAVARGERSR